jgi:hypothetical protein
MAELNLPILEIADEPMTPTEVLGEYHKSNETFDLIHEVYTIGMLDDAAFEGSKAKDYEELTEDYDGILLLGVTLHSRENSLLPTRSQLADIARAFNRRFAYTPVVVLYHYSDTTEQYLAFANTERTAYKQAWREGEKAGKVSLLRDIQINKPHRGHHDIIAQLQIPTSGKKAIDNFTKLYAYWQDVFSVNVLNKKFYQELSNWYFWAIKHVTFPSEPTAESILAETGKSDTKTLTEKIQEHKAKNVIRLLTRLLFTWFIKEKKLIPDELFDLETLQEDILKEIAPYQEGDLLVKASNESVYYKAVLQNLFFASLNCPIDTDGEDTRKRGFRSGKSNTHYAIDHLMRYEKHFKDPAEFLKMMNETVPFLNGGLFECLDDKINKKYIDGFTDNPTKQKKLVVPDFLFFGVSQEVDLRVEYGVNSKQAKQAAVKGLINILKSYKFTITENTPIEEDVALDPELLGKVFENLLASYNPETKTTARKQTGSFYTPREIVNYMVDESLIAYLKTQLLHEEESYAEFGDNQTSLLPSNEKKTQTRLETKTGSAVYAGTEDELDKELHTLFAYEEGNPYAENEPIKKAIIQALDRCKILDPACGSGAYPMGILQKMVHVLNKLDPNNQAWKDLQIGKAKQETDKAFGIEDKEERADKLLEINDVFDQKINDADYARKLFLIENCIYGVDIQPVATQISKLRFFISLVVEQKVNTDKPNFGIRPLPNLETKFVAANTLIGIEKPSAQLSLYDTKEVRKLERELKRVRHKLFSAKTKDTKKKYRGEDERLRNEIATELTKTGWANETADKLASWDPYDQNASSSFFDPEWMFDISKGFDVVIGNPPYVTYKGKERVEISAKDFTYLIDKYKNSAEYKVNSYALFIENAFLHLTKNGVMTFIIPSTILQNDYLKKIREFLLKKWSISILTVFNNTVFGAVTDSIILQSNKMKKTETKVLKKSNLYFNSMQDSYETWNTKDWIESENSVINVRASQEEIKILKKISSQTERLDKYFNVYVGIVASGIKKFISSEKLSKDHKKYLLGRDISNFAIQYKSRFINFIPHLLHSNTDKNVYLQKKKILIRKTGNKLMGAIDDQQYFTDQSLYNVYNKANTDEKLLFLCNILLNSKVLDFYFNKKIITNPDIFPYIKGVHIKSLPLKITNINLNHTKTLNYVIQSNASDCFRRVNNSFVFNLYFPEHMQEKGIDVKDYIEQDIAAAMQGRDWDELSEGQKTAVTEQLQATWTDPTNEVVKRMSQFKEKSPDILQVILES